MSEDETKELQDARRAVFLTHLWQPRLRRQLNYTRVLFSGAEQCSWGNIFTRRKPVLLVWEKDRLEWFGFRHGSPSTEVDDIETSVVKVLRLPENLEKEALELVKPPEEPYRCVVCLDKNKPMTLVMPCGHTVACQECSQTAQQRQMVDTSCYVCRQPIERIVYDLCD